MKRMKENKNERQLHALVKQKETDDMTSRSKLIRTRLHTFHNNELEFSDLISAHNHYTEKDGKFISLSYIA